MMSPAQSSGMRVSQRISARLGSIAQVAGRHRPMSKRSGPTSGAEVTASRRLAASLRWACRSGIRRSCDAVSLRDSRKSAPCCRNCRNCLTCRERGIAWLLLLYCASPRAQHALRAVPPMDSAAYAAEHDQAVWTTVQHLLAEQDTRGREWHAARQIAFLPAASGGLGLANAERLAPAAYCAAWVDALSVMLQRCLEVARRYAQELALGGGSTAPCLRAAAAAGDRLLAEGWSAHPEWDDLLHGVRPPPTHTEPSEPGSWPHGWQKLAARSHAQHVLSRAPPQQLVAEFPGSAALPGGRACRRVPLASARCGGHGEPGCRAVVDQLGDHRAACARSGLLARRAPILERAWVRVAREAITAEGRVVPRQWLAQTTAPGVAPDDRRRLDLVIYGASRRGEALW